MIAKFLVKRKYILDDITIMFNVTLLVISYLFLFSWCFLYPTFSISLDILYAV